MSKRLTMTIDGKSVDTQARLQVRNPANAKVFASVPDAGAVQLNAAVAAAKRAFPEWRDKPWSERQALVANIGKVIGENAVELTAMLTREQGKPHEQAHFEIMSAAQWCGALATMELPDKVIAETHANKVLTRYVPIGVVAAISPWNFPVLLSIWKIAPALLTGNTMVLKPSPFTPMTVLKLGELLRDVLPPGVLNIVTGGEELGPLMTAHPGIDKVSFTGSTATGRRVMESAAPTLKRLTLELGGNDAAIIFPDVDVGETAQKLFWSAFTNSGQVCIATKRAYVHDDIYDQFLDALTKISEEDEAVRRANNSDMGLAATVWTNDLERALRVADKLETGNVWINEALAVSPFAAFGGRKQSGVGAENGVEGLLAFTEPKTITFQRP
ncbi:MAG TPA: aldehyde dehydrogenase family protein [Polyangiales bacterium]|nr:aldehyde dehydrogenase family protein [Polyangiales bacterium]